VWVEVALAHLDATEIRWQDHGWLERWEPSGSMNESASTVTVEDFEKIDIRVGRVVEVVPFPEGRPTPSTNAISPPDPNGPC
jgi:hypothetical protein